MPLLVSACRFHSCCGALAPRGRLPVWKSLAHINSKNAIEIREATSRLFARPSQRLSDGGWPAPSLIQSNHTYARTRHLLLDVELGERTSRNTSNARLIHTHKDGTA